MAVLSKSLMVRQRTMTSFLERLHIGLVMRANRYRRFDDGPMVPGGRDINKNCTHAQMRDFETAVAAKITIHCRSIHFDYLPHT